MNRQIDVANDFEILKKATTIIHVHLIQSAYNSNDRMKIQEPEKKNVKFVIHVHEVIRFRASQI